MADGDDKEPGKPKADEAVQEALEAFRESEDGTSFTRQQAYDDVKFARLGDQWPDDIRKQRQAEGRPCLTINKLPAFVRQVVNDSRQNKPGIKVSPVDNGADVASAEVIGGLIRGIERRSNAEIAYDTAIDHAVSGGFGFFRIAIDYLHDDTFDLECLIQRVPNQWMVHWDPNSTAFDSSDWNYAFVSDFLDEDEFEARYPGATPVSFDGDSRDLVAPWIESDKVRVAEYWRRTQERRPLYLLTDAEGNAFPVRKDDLPRLARQTAEAGGIDVEGMSDDDLIAGYLAITRRTIARQRLVPVNTVKRCTMSGAEILEEDPWPGSTIPICPVWGEEVYLDGRRHFRSMIRDAISPQQAFNFWRSATTELVALAPRAPWVGPEGFVPKGSEHKWDTANTRSWAHLEYVEGKAPTRQPFAGVPAGALQEALNASDDIKAIIGIYDASLGARSNETSGRAILARQREADVSNFHFIDNLNRAIAAAGKILVEIIPAVYSTRETIRILGDDRKEQVVQLTQQDGGATQPGPDGGPALYNLSVGKYDVTVSTGPSYATQREEARETLVEIMRAVPGSAQFIGDVLLEHMDFVGAEKVAKRLQALLPPQVQAAEGIAPPQGQGQPAAPQPDPLEQEERRATIEQKRAAAIANLAKAGATQLGMEQQAFEAVLRALASVAPEQGQPMPQMGQPAPPNPGMPPGQPPLQ